MEKDFKFTKRSLNALQIPDKGKRAIYRDTENSNLSIRLTGTGSKSFIVYRKVNGRPLLVTLGKYPKMTIEQARKLADEVSSKLNVGTNPNDEKRAIREEETLGGFFSIYMENHAKLYKRSWTEDERQYNQHLKSWANRKLSAITTDKIRVRHSKIARESGLYSANRVLALLSIMFNKARDWGWPHDNPAKGVKKFKEKSRDRFLQADELPRFFKALAEEPNTTARDFFLVALLTGARRSNVLSMRWEQISFEREEWKIPETKNGEAHTLPLIGGVVDILRHRKEVAKAEAEQEEKKPSPFVFPGNGKTGHLVEPKMAWKRILERAELYGLLSMLGEAGSLSKPDIEAWEDKGREALSDTLTTLRELAEEAGITVENASMGDLRIHDLRRSLGSWQAATGANLSIIGKTLAHKNVSTTAIYARLNIDPVRESMKKATDAMLQAGGVLPSAEVVELKSKNR